MESIGITHYAMTVAMTLKKQQEVNEVLDTHEKYCKRHDDLLKLISIADDINVDECEMNMLCRQLQSIKSTLSTIEDLLEEGIS